jgi:PhoD-like phosphatase
MSAGSLVLGPIVGHTDHESTRIWIQVRDDPSRYTLRVKGVGVFPFESTEGLDVELGTSIAACKRLRPEWKYRYQVFRDRRAVNNADGSFRTMPSPGSFADALFVSVSCSHATELGIWPRVAEYVKRAQPRFLIMMGDQVYLDHGNGDDVWAHHLTSNPATRRRAMASKYQKHWGREPIRTILANIPTYMMWDDHDIRNGWGSYAPDSPTLAAAFPKGAPIADRYDAYFEDARDTYWRFQMCVNPPPPAAPDFPSPGIRKGVPFTFRCGRLCVLVVDDRGARDIWRASSPILGDEQWKFIDDTLANLPSDVDAVAVVVPLPVASMSPDGLAMFLLGSRTDDVELFKRGDAKGLLDMLNQESNLLDAPISMAGAAAGKNWGVYKLDSLSDIRDNWAHSLSRPEQARLIRAANEARYVNRLASQPRALVFIGGDLHAGGKFSISVTNPDGTVPSLIASGVARQAGKGEGIVGILMDRDFEIADGITAKLEEFVRVYNFGVTHVAFTGGGTPVVTNAVANVDDNDYLSLKIG